MKCAWIDRQRAGYPTLVLCRVLGVGRSGFYGWRARRGSPPGPRRLRRERVDAAVAAARTPGAAAPTAPARSPRTCVAGAAAAAAAFRAASPHSGRCDAKGCPAGSRDAAGRGPRGSTRALRPRRPRRTC